MRIQKTILLVIAMMFIMASNALGVMSASSLIALAFPPPPGGDNWFYTPNSGFYDSTPPAASNTDCLEIFGNQVAYTTTEIGGIGGWDVICDAYTIGFKRVSLFNSDFSKSAIMGKTQITGSNQTPYSGGQAGGRYVCGKLEPSEYQFQIRLWLANDNSPVGTITCLYLWRVQARQETASAVFSQANAYPLPPVRGTAYDPIAFTTPNSSNDVRDTLDVEASLGYGVGTHIPWVRSNSSGPTSHYASYPTNGGLEYYGGSGHQLGPSDYLHVRKDADGWYRLYEYPNYVDLSIPLGDYPQIVHAFTITNLGDTGPYPHIGTANAMSLRQMRIYWWLQQN